MPRLIENWKRVLLKAWSLRITYIFAALYALGVLWPGLAGSIPWEVFLVIGIPLIAVVRLVKQDDL